MTDTLLYLNTHWLLLSTFLLIIGLLFGSFFNVVIHRLPIMLEQQWQTEIAYHQNQTEPATSKFNLAWPESHCPHCKHSLKWWHNIPLLSYLLLKGRCGYCKTGIAIRYPLVELFTGLIWSGLGLTYGLNLALFFALILSSVLIILMVIDFETQLLPDSLTLSCLWIGLLVNIRPTFAFTHVAIYGAIAGYLTLWIISTLFSWIRKKQGMGHGDMKMLAMLGAWFGILQIYYCLLLAVLIGILLFAVFYLQKKANRDTPIAFGPGLALSGLLFLFIQPYLPWPLALLVT